MARMPVPKCAEHCRGNTHLAVCTEKWRLIAVGRPNPITLHQLRWASSTRDGTNYSTREEVDGAPDSCLDEIKARPLLSEAIVKVRHPFIGLGPEIRIHLFACS
eukprot:scpid97073/ scgid14902/ 